MTDPTSLSILYNLRQNFETENVRGDLVSQLEEIVTYDTFSLIIPSIGPRLLSVQI